MSSTNLQHKEYTIENPVEIDKAIESLRLILAELSWVSNPYHIAQRFYERIDSKGFYFPYTYVKNADEPNFIYLRLTPDNSQTGMFFFLVGKNTIDYAPNEYNYKTYPVSIIFNANLELIDQDRLDKYLFTQDLIRSAIRKLTENGLNFDFQYKIISETRDLREVYREFVLDDIEQYNRAPLQCFRLDLTLTLQEDCEF